MTASSLGVCPRIGAEKLGLGGVFDRGEGDQSNAAAEWGQISAAERPLESLHRRI